MGNTPLTRFTPRFIALALALIAGAPLVAQTYFHDEVGRLVQVSYSDGHGIRYDYDEADNLTAVQPLTLPDAPTNLLVNRLSGTTVKLIWIDNSTNETGFVVMRRAIGDSIWTQIALVAPNSQQYTDDTATTGLDYAYRISAQGTEGLSAYSGTPTTVISMLMISSAGLREGTQGIRIELAFPTTAGAVYRIESTADLTAPSWQSATFSTSLDGAITQQTSDGTGASQSVFLNVTASPMYFRLRRE
jgi:YD repeat-containing protein